jgi:hypothetical protein
MDLHQKIDRWRAVRQQRRVGRRREQPYEASTGTRQRYGSIVIPAGSRSVTLTLDALAPSAGAAGHGPVSLIPNGDDYVACAQRCVSF